MSKLTIKTITVNPSKMKLVNAKTCSLSLKILFFLHSTLDLSIHSDLATDPKTLFTRKAINTLQLWIPSLTATDHAEKELIMASLANKEHAAAPTTTTKAAIRNLQPISKTSDNKETKP